MSDQALSPSITAPPASGDVLHECPDCGLFQHAGPMRPDQVAVCDRCGAVLRRRRRDSLTTTFALSVTGLVLMAIACGTTLVRFRLAGQQMDTGLLHLPVAFTGQNMPFLAVAVAFTTVAAPALRLALTACVLGGLRIPAIPRALLVDMARLRHLLKPWAMVEVFMLGLFVAYTRLAALAIVEVGPAVLALGALMLIYAWADTWLDEHAMWEAIASFGTPPAPPTQPTPGAQRIGCDVCGHVTHAHEHDPCPRCGTRLRHRKPQPISRTWALLVTGAILYLPANIYPVMTVIRFGRGAPSTILGGVQELVAYRMWPLALLVFVASIMVPMLKLLGLTYLLITTQRRRPNRLVERTRIYRAVDFIGRWSMIDIFMMAILVALVRMGILASVDPGLGALAFCAVVWLTMIAAMTFDPRLMWDLARQNAPAPTPPQPSQHDTQPGAAIPA